MTSGETKRQEMTSGDVPVCWIPLLICFESTGRKKRGGIPCTLTDDESEWGWSVYNDQRIGRQ